MFMELTDTSIDPVTQNIHLITYLWDVKIESQAQSVGMVHI